MSKFKSSLSPRARIFSSLLAGAAVWLSARGARAGNDDGILIGGQAALTAGAITATVSDGSAAWYNPAGIARATQQTLDVNASVYGISLISADHFITLPDGTSTQATTTDWQLIPSALSYTRQLSPRITGAFSIIVPKTADYNLIASATQADGRELIFAYDRLRNEYDYIVTLGFRVTDNLRLGFAVQGIYISSEQKLQIGAGQPDVADTPFLSYSSHSTIGDYGARLGLGLQWSATRSLELGLALQTPTLTGYRSIRDVVLNGASTADGSSYRTDNQDKFKSVWELSTPLSVRAGVAYQIAHVQIMLDGSFYSPLNSSQPTLDRKLSGNGRLACLVKLSEKITFGLGVFTDLTAQREPNADFVGVAGGVRLATPHRMEGGRTLTFLTTLGGRYAYGWGHTRGVNFATDDGSDYELVKVKLQTHELAFNLGGGVSF